MLLAVAWVLKEFRGIHRLPIDSIWWGFKARLQRFRIRGSGPQSREYAAILLQTLKSRLPGPLGTPTRFPDSGALSQQPSRCVQNCYSGSVHATMDCDCFRFPRLLPHHWHTSSEDPSSPDSNNRFHNAGDNNHTLISRQQILFQLPNNTTTKVPAQVPPLAKVLNMNLVATSLTEGSCSCGCWIAGTSEPASRAA